MQYRTLRPSSPDPRTNMREIFQRYPSLRAFGHLYKLFGDHMVGMCGKAALLTRKLAQAAATAMRAFALQFATQPTMPVANILDRPAAMNRTVTVNGDVAHTEVYAQRALNVDRLGFFHVADRKQVKRVVDKGEIGFTMPRLEQLPLTLATCERDVQSSSNRPDRHGPPVHLPRQDAVIVGNCAVWSEGPLSSAVKLVGVGNLGDTPDGQLCRQPEGGSNVAVDKFVERELTEGASVPSNTTDRVTGSIGSFKRALQGLRLFGCWLKLQLCAQFHDFIVLNTCDIYCHTRKEDRRFLCHLKETVSAPTFL